MSLDDLEDAVGDVYADLDEETTVELDRQSRNELAMLAAAFEADRDELVRRGIHTLFRTAVETGDVDFNLRQEFDVTYDEYLAGMTFEEMTGQDQYPQYDDERRYQM